MGIWRGYGYQYICISRERGAEKSGDLNQVDRVRQQDVKLLRAIWIRFDWRHTPGSAQRIYDPNTNPHPNC